MTKPTENIKIIERAVARARENNEDVSLHPDTIDFLIGRRMPKFPGARRASDKETPVPLYDETDMVIL